MDTQRIVAEACAKAGLDASNAAPVRLADNAIWRLPGTKIIVRIPAAGSLSTSTKQIQVSNWLEQHGISAARVITDIAQPIIVKDRAVTFWAELPPHKPGSIMDVVHLLKRLHDLPTPSFLKGLEPFIRVADRIDAAAFLSHDDRKWLRGELERLQETWSKLSRPSTDCVIHGDAWVGNCVIDEDGRPYLLDFDRCSIGPPEWDLVSTAIKLTTTNAITRREYNEFCEAYGLDVLQWSGYEALRSIRELRMTTWAAQVAIARLEWRSEVQYRIRCLRNQEGPRPWKWQTIS